MPVSQKVREEMLPRLRQRYGNRGREGRSRMIQEMAGQFGYSRKHAIKLLGAKAGWGGDSAMDKRTALRGIFWILDNGVKWKDLPSFQGFGTDSIPMTA